MGRRDCLGLAQRHAPAPADAGINGGLFWHSGAGVGQALVSRHRFNLRRNRRGRRAYFLWDCRQLHQKIPDECRPDRDCGGLADGSGHRAAPPDVLHLALSADIGHGLGSLAGLRLDMYRDRVCVVLQIADALRPTARHDRHIFNSSIWCVVGLAVPR